MKQVWEIRRPEVQCEALCVMSLFHIEVNIGNGQQKIRNRNSEQGYRLKISIWNH